MDPELEIDGEMQADTAVNPAKLAVFPFTHLRGPADVDPGSIVEVHIVDALDYDLVAEVRTA